MHRVATCINETQQKELDIILEKLGMSEYELTKTLLLDFIKHGNIDVAKAKLLLKMAVKEAYEILDNAP